MKIPFNNLFLQVEHNLGEYMQEIEDCIKNSSFIGGHQVETFEENFAKLNNSEFAVSCANGTDSLMLSMKALDIKPGDEVIVPAMTWISTAETVTACGAIPVFCDIDIETYTIDTSLIEELINEKTVGIIPVHLYGHPCDMEKISQISDKYNLWIIEDCAQAHLAEYKNKYVGTFGSFGSFSFFPGKNLGAFGDAGGIITNNESLAKSFTRYARHGGLIKGEHVIEGYNSRLDTLQAIILNKKMPLLQSWTNERRKISKQISAGLNGTEGLVIPKESDNCKHSWHLYVVRVSNREEFSAYLKSKEISSGIHYPKALPFLKAYDYKNHSEKDFPVAAKIQNEILSLPLFPSMGEDKINYLVESVRGYFD